MGYLKVLDEGALVQDYCVQLNFVGAGVAATRPSSNDAVTVTIPGAADVTGWTDDGAVVRLTTVGDAVAIGAAVQVGTEKVRVVNAAGVAIRVEGREDFPATGVAASGATQAASFVERMTASMWTGAAAVERDLDLYAGPTTLAADEATTARAALCLDTEGFRTLEIFSAVAAPAAAPPVLFRTQAVGAVTGFTFRAAGAPSNIFAIVSNDGMTDLWYLTAGGQVLMTDGAVGLPVLSFLGDANTGIYRIGADEIGVSVGASMAVDVKNNGGTLEIGFLGAASVPRQNAATPSVAELKAGLVALGLFNA